MSQNAMGSIISDPGKEFNPAELDYVDPGVVPQLDVDGLDNVITAEIDTREESIDTLEENIASLSKIEDNVLGYETHNEPQKQAYDKVLKQHNLSEQDMLNVDIRDRFAVEDLNRKVSKAFSDPRIQNIEREKTIANAIHKRYAEGSLSFDHPELQKEFLKNLNGYYTGETGPNGQPITAYDLRPDDYQYIDYDTEINTGLEAIEEELTAEFKNDPTGAAYVQSKQQRSEALVQGLIDAAIDNPRLRNSLIADGMIDRETLELTEKGRAYFDNKVKQFTIAKTKIDQVKGATNKSGAAPGTYKDELEEMFPGNTAGAIKNRKVAEALEGSYGMRISGDDYESQDRIARASDAFPGRPAAAAAAYIADEHFHEFMDENEKEELIKSLFTPEAGQEIIGVELDPETGDIIVHTADPKFEDETESTRIKYQTWTQDPGLVQKAGTRVAAEREARVREMQEQATARFKENKAYLEVADIIAAPESGAGGYNSVAFDDGRKSVGDDDYNFPGSDKPLTEMTVAEVRAAIADPKSKTGAGTAAIGKYQFRLQTLDEALGYLGYGDDTVLSEAVQEDIFKNYLIEGPRKRPAVRKLIRMPVEDITDADIDAAVKAIRQEFVALDTDEKALEFLQSYRNYWQQENAVAEALLRGQGANRSMVLDPTNLGVVTGDTGNSSGSHIDVRMKGGGDSREYLDAVIVDHGSNRLTLGDYVNGNESRLSFHNKDRTWVDPVDIGIAAGRPIQLNPNWKGSPVKSVELRVDSKGARQPKEGTSGGFYTVIKFEDGNEMWLMHMGAQSVFNNQTTKPAEKTADEKARDYVDRITDRPIEFVPGKGEGKPVIRETPTEEDEVTESVDKLRGFLEGDESFLHTGTPEDRRGLGGGVPTPEVGVHTPENNKELTGDEAKAILDKKPNKKAEEGLTGEYAKEVLDKKPTGKDAKKQDPSVGQDTLSKVSEMRGTEGVQTTKDVDTIKNALEKNKNLDFVKRMYDSELGDIELGSGERGTHLLEVSDNIVYPRIVNIDGSLQLLDSDKAYEYAMKNKEFIEFENEADALLFSQNYKDFTPRFKSSETQNKTEGPGNSKAAEAVVAREREAIKSRLPGAGNVPVKVQKLSPPETQKPPKNKPEGISNPAFDRVTKATTPAEIVGPDGSGLQDYYDGLGGNEIEKVKRLQELNPNILGNPLLFAATFTGLDENNPDHQDTIAGFLNQAVPGFVKDSSEVTRDDRAWCAAFVTHVLESTGNEVGGQYERLRARSFRNFGTKVDSVDSAKLGDVVVIKRPNGSFHVGFYAGKDENGNVLMLGGNQNNQVTIMNVAKEGSTVDAIRRPQSMKDIMENDLKVILETSSVKALSKKE